MQTLVESGHRQIMIGVFSGLGFYGNLNGHAALRITWIFGQMKEGRRKKKVQGMLEI
jgi:hypothetical protein